MRQMAIAYETWDGREEVLREGADTGVDSNSLWQ